MSSSRQNFRTCAKVAIQVKSNSKFRWAFWDHHGAWYGRHSTRTVAHSGARTRHSCKTPCPLCATETDIGKHAHRRTWHWFCRRHHRPRLPGRPEKNVSRSLHCRRCPGLMISSSTSSCMHAQHTHRHTHTHTHTHTHSDARLICHEHGHTEFLEQDQQAKHTDSVATTHIAHRLTHTWHTDTILHIYIGQDHTDAVDWAGLDQSLHPIELNPAGKQRVAHPACVWRPLLCCAIYWLQLRAPCSAYCRIIVRLSFATVSFVINPIIVW